MASNALTRTYTLLKAVLAVASIATVAVLIPTLIPTPGTSEAYLTRPQTHDQWVVLEEQDILSGATVPQDTNVVIHIPLSVPRINREVLFGMKGKSTRYWGYCYPENSDPAVVESRVGFKGLIFLSEKERAVRAEAQKATEPTYNLRNLPTKEDLLKLAARPVTPIRHQLDYFVAGQLCYVMTETPLPIGADDDNDRLNNRLEKDLGTDPLIEDTDGDGILDGVEVKYDIDPLQRDTDLDGVIDGIEDADWNGIIDPGETDPRSKDSDRDGLCDGQCRMKLSNGQLLYTGEDRNLDGIVNNSETDPRLEDTDGDGTHDFQEYLICLTQGKRACK